MKASTEVKIYTTMSFGGKSFKREELRLKKELQQLTKRSKNEFAGLNTSDKSKFLESRSTSAAALQKSKHKPPKKPRKNKLNTVATPDIETNNSDEEIPPPSPSIDLGPELQTTPEAEIVKPAEKELRGSVAFERRNSDLISRSTAVASIRSKVDLNVVMYGKGLGDESCVTVEPKVM